MPKTSSRPNETDLRLRSWLDANQQDRERLCLALLSLDSRFRNLVPRHPQGGPDGGRDIQGTLEDSRAVWIAVGFLNNVSDSPANIRLVKKKFEEDLERALSNNLALQAFVFMTNVRLPVATIRALEKYARSKKITFCEIFHRERLRILLDGPDGLGFRFQYLQLSLSEAEQAAFFARWGRQLESVIAQKFSAVDSQLARLEFLHDCQRPLRSIGFLLDLKNAATLVELGHYRVLLSISKLGGGSKYSGLLVGARDHELKQSKSRTRDDTVSGGFWIAKWEDEENTDQMVTSAAGASHDAPKRDRAKQGYSTFSSLCDQPFSRIGASGGYSSVLDEMFPPPSLGDLDENFISIFVTKPLVERIQKIEVFANGYILQTRRNEEITTHHRLDGSFDDLWPEELTTEEALVEWVRLDINHGSSQISFAYQTPHKKWRPIADDPDVPIVNPLRKASSKTAI